MKTNQHRTTKPVQSNCQITLNDVFTYVIFDEVCRHKVVATDPSAAVWKLLGRDLKNYDMGDMARGETIKLVVMEEQENTEFENCGTIALESNGSGGVWEWQWWSF